MQDYSKINDKTDPNYWLQRFFDVPSSADDYGSMEINIIIDDIYNVLYHRVGNRDHIVDRLSFDQANRLENIFLELGKLIVYMRLKYGTENF